MILGRQPTAIIVLALIVTTIQPSSITVQFRDNIPNPNLMADIDIKLDTCHYQTLGNYYPNEALFLREIGPKIQENAAP